MPRVSKSVARADQAEREGRRWKSELALAGKREKDWRDEAEKIVKRYRAEERRKNAFNVLWANTEILRPAIYNSQPNPDVRRRFRDADPLGKAVSEVLERALVVVVDQYSTDCAIQNDVFDALVPARGVSRVRYVPSLRQVPATSEPAATPATGVQPAEDAEGDPEREAEVEEELEYEQACIEHVDWRDFRHGFGRTWEEVPWVGFRCSLTKAEAEKKFGPDALAEIKFSPPQSDEPKKPEQVSEIEKVAEFWEVWDKEGGRVFFTQEHAKRLLFPLDTPNGEPPLELQGFFPCPRPLLLVENTGSLVPIPLYRLYEEQALEVETLSKRINRIVATLRLRGVYDSRLDELADLTTADDNDMVPIKNAAMWANAGGIDKAISWMPVEQAAKVLDALYRARQLAKQVIDEILGISDIVRGATMASETATAQQIKANYASIRIQRMQREVQRYVRDLLRLCAEVIANKFDAQTLAQMTGLKFPDATVRDQARAALAQAQQTGQPADPMAEAAAKLPTWDEIVPLLRNDALRQFKVDVETDSTVSGTLESDMSGVSEVLTAVTNTLNGLAPLVMQGALPVDAAKELVMAVVRRARLGLAVEDALDKLQAPQPPAAPAEAPDRSVEVAQVKAQADVQLEQLRLAHDTQLEAAKRQSEQAIAAAKAQAEAAASQADADVRRYVAELNAAVQLELGRMTANVQTAKVQADAAAAERQEAAQAAERERAAQAPAEPAAEAPAASSAGIDLAALVAQMTATLSRPRRVLRDGDGRIAGVE